MGLYYVSSRYYDSEIGRWINADGYVSTGQNFIGYNMFAYCLNNAVNRIDELGSVSRICFSDMDYAIRDYDDALGGGGIALGAIGSLALLAATAEADSKSKPNLPVLDEIGYGIYQAAQAPAISIPKVEEKSEAIVVPKEPDSPVIFPVDPNAFNPVGLIKVPRAGTKILSVPMGHITTYTELDIITKE